LRPDDEFAWLCHSASVGFLRHHQYSGTDYQKGWVADGGFLRLLHSAITGER
jgi:hypothetical protein